jgi:sterol desaturase/sphingolipid hydroxylase (fatty acid hydroxylase superfamily)
MHRAQHFSRWLWAEHELHHSDEHVDVTTGTRHHYFELVLMPLFIYAPLAIVFDISGRIALSWMMVTQLFIYFIHMDARIGFGPFNRILANPQIHRIHHSRLPEHIDKNFAAYFPLWDVIFGTYYHPRKSEYPPSGLASGRQVNSQIEAAIMPVQTWIRMLTEKAPEWAEEQQ